MEIKKDYAVSSNAISDVIKLLEKCVQVLKDAQTATEEMYISADENDEDDSEM